MMRTLSDTRLDRSRPKARGMSLVELMVGITIGLFIVAAAVTLVASQLSDNRRLTLELQVQQDLRATADIIARQLRRTGGLDVGSAQDQVATLTDPVVSRNLLAIDSIAVALPTDRVDYAYYFRPGDQGPYGFRLNSGRIETLMGGGGWQDLTDPLTMRVTQFSVDNPTDTGALPASDPLPCLRPCADGTSSCWPTLAPRVLQITIRAESTSDPTVQRELVSRVRLRNDLLQFNGPLPTSPLCPAG